MFQVGGDDELRKRLRDARRAWRAARRAEAAALHQAHRQVAWALEIGIARSAAAEIVGVVREASVRATTMPSTRRIAVGNSDAHHQVGVHWRAGVLYPPTLDAHQRRDVERTRRRLEAAGERLAATREDTASARAALVAAAKSARSANISRREIARVTGLARDTLADLGI